MNIINKNRSIYRNLANLFCNNNNIIIFPLSFINWSPDIFHMLVLHPAAGMYYECCVHLSEPHRF